MTTQNDEPIQNDDPTLLKVKGESGFQNDEERKFYIKKLTSAILTVVGKHGYARLKTVGASSGMNAWKAAANARGEAVKRGIDLVVEPSYDEATFDGNIKTAMVFKVIPRQEKSDAE